MSGAISGCLLELIRTSVSDCGVLSGGIVERFEALEETLAHFRSESVVLVVD